MDCQDRFGFYLSTDILCKKNKINELCILESLEWCKHAGAEMVQEAKF